MSTLVKSTAIFPRRSPNIKRATALLSDGSVALCVIDNNISGGAGDGTNVSKIYIYHSTNRSTWTLKNTITPSADIYNAAPPLVAFSADSSDNLYLAYVRATDDAINYVKLTFSAGPTWTPGSTETVKAAMGANYFRQIDMDVHPVSGVPIVVALGFTGTTYKFYHYVRRTSDSTWRECINDTVWTSGTPVNLDCSVAWNRLSGGGSGGRTYYSFFFSMASVTTNPGDQIRLYSFDTASGTTSTYESLVEGAFNANQGAKYKKQWLFSTGSYEWSIVGVCGLSSSFIYAMRFVVQAGTAIITKTGAYTKTTHSTAFTDYSPLADMWVAAVYSDEEFAVVGSGSNKLVYATSGQFTRSGATSSISFAPENYLWDNSFTSGSARYPIFVYGGNNNRITSGFYKLDTILGDGPADSTVASANPLNARHQYNYANVAPKNVTPGAGSTQLTNVPPLTALVDLDVDNPQGRVKVRWVLATNSIFTLNVRTIDEPDSAFRRVNNTATGAATITATSVVPTASALFTGTWYVKAAFIGENGQVGTYSAAQSFSVGHPPSAIGVSPSGDEYLKYVDVSGNTVVGFDWTFSDPSPTDSQSAYRVIVENADTGASVVNTGKITSTVTSANVNVPAAAKEIQLRWKVDVWDVDDTQSTVSSGYQTFYVGDPPTVSVTAPVEASTINTPSPTIAYTPTMIGARYMQSFRVVLTKDLATDVQVYDSGWLSVAATGPFSFTVPSGILENTSNYFVDVYVRDNENLEGTDRNSFSTSWTAPAAPSFTASATSYDTLGYVGVTWTNASIDADWISWRVYRRTYSASGPTYGAWILLYETTVDLSSYSYHDWLAGSDQGYQYTVVQVADRFGSAVESAYNTSIVTPSTDKYWLIHPLDESYNLPLYVAGEKFKDEYEEATHHIIGRGRKLDYGDRLGYIGSLDLHLRDRTGYTARQQRMDLEALKAQQTPLYLRNPFGDIILVNVSDISIDRIAGVGKHEAVNVSLEYAEVAT